MYTFETSRHFTKRVDPGSGQTYYVLSLRVAPVQRGCPSIVAFYNLRTDRAVNIVTRNPELPAWTATDPCPYHIDPHPRFVLNDRWIVFTTTTQGRVDAAAAPVEPLIEATGGR